jgi:hypothetical protein
VDAGDPGQRDRSRNDARRVGPPRVVNTEAAARAKLLGAQRGRGYALRLTRDEPEVPGRGGAAGPLAIDLGALQADCNFLWEELNELDIEPREAQTEKAFERLSPSQAADLVPAKARDASAI